MPKHRLAVCLLIFALILGACGNSGSSNGPNAPASNAGAAANNAQEAQSGVIVYPSENGPVEVPANPQRVVVFNPFAGHVAALGVGIAGADVWAHQNPEFQSHLANAEEVSEDNLEQLLELEPDLIIGLSTLKDVDKLNEIAPTVTFTHGKLDYLAQFLEIGKLLNKEAEARAWIDDFQARAQAAGEKIKAKIGEDATVSIIENFGKELYVYANNFGRGSEILYREMKINMPEKVKEHALEAGYYALSLEVLPDFAGDYLIFSKDSAGDLSFQSTETYKNIPAVKNNRVFEVDSKSYFLNDPITLEYQLAFFEKSFLGGQ